LLPSSATQVLSGGTLTIVESNSSAPDVISQTATTGSKFRVTDSSGTFTFNGVNNIVFTAATTGVDLVFNDSDGNTFAGNISVNSSATEFSALTVSFDGSFNTTGKVTIANTGGGDSTEVDVAADHLGGLTVTGGAAVPSGFNFATIDDAATRNGSFSGVLVDLEGTTIGSSGVNVNMGGGGGYFITDELLDLGKLGNVSESGAQTVNIAGGLTITDLNTLFNDTFQLWNGDVSGNVSIHVSAVGTNEAIVPGEGPLAGGINIEDYKIGKSATINQSVTAGFKELLTIENSSITGNVAIIQSASGGDCLALLENSSITHGNLSVIQGGVGGLASFAAAGSLDSIANTINGSVTINQSGAGNEALVGDFASISGAVTINQSGSSLNFADVANISSINSSLTINQSNVSNTNTIDITDAAITSTSINQGTSSNGSIATIDTVIDGNLSITQLGGGGGANAGTSVEVNSSTIFGAMKIQQTSGETNTVNILASETAAITVNQSGAAAADYFLIVGTGTEIINGSVNVTQGGAIDDATAEVVQSIAGSVTMTQNGTAMDSGGIGLVTTIKGAITIKEAGTTENDAQVNEVNNITGAVTVSQSAVAANNSIFVDAGGKIAGSVTITQAAATDFALVDVSGDQISGIVYIHSLPGGGGVIECSLANDVIKGNVSINQSSAGQNEVYINNSSISGSLTVIQSGNTADSNYLGFSYGSTIGGSVTINQSASSNGNQVNVGSSTIKGNLSINQSSANQNAVDFYYSALAAVTIVQGAGFDEVFVENDSIISGNLSINGASTVSGESEVYIVGGSAVSGKTVTIAEGAGDNTFKLADSTITDNLSINFGAGINLVDMYDSQVGGKTTMNIGVSGTGLNVIDFGADSAADDVMVFAGQVSVNTGKGVTIVTLGSATAGVLFEVNASFTGNPSADNTYNEIDAGGTVKFSSNFASG
jgi:hypothetical protein